MADYYDTYVSEMNLTEFLKFLEDLYGRGKGGYARASIKTCKNKNFTKDNYYSTPWDPVDVGELEIDSKKKLKFWILIGKRSSSKKKDKIEYLEKFGFRKIGE